jgi:hypothetical protein
MSNLSKNTEQKYILNGVRYNAPEGLEDVTIEANYINDNIQPSLTVSDYTFNLEAKQAIQDWFNGPIGGFEGMPFELILYNNQAQQVSFKAFLDFYSNYEELENDGRVNTTIIKEEGIDDLFSKLESLTYGFLEQNGTFTQSDYVTVPYVVEKKFNLFELLMSTVMLFLMIKELAEAVRAVIDNAMKFTAALTPSPGVGPTGPVLIPVSIGGVIYATISLIIQVLYTTILLIAIINLATNLFNSLVPLERKHKAILLKTALSKVATFLGYSLSAPDSIFGLLHYLPSNPRLDEKKSSGFIQSTKGTPTGIPNVVDYGYNCADMFNLAKELINGKIAVVNGVIHLRPKSDPFWQQQSNWQMPDVLIESKKYNLSELKSTKVIQFRIDQNDEWTIDNYKGTAYEIKTEPITVSNQKAVLLRGLEEINFPVALGNRKDKLNAIETLLKSLGSLVDNTTRVLGGGTNFASAINSKKGVLKQTDNWHTIPKILPLSGGRLPTNHRSLFNAKLLWDNYLNYDSFIQNNFKRQRALYENVTIPFGIEDFKQLTQNSYFNFNGNLAKITNFTWVTGRDTATISFWVEETYTRNLKESYIEPQ